MNTLRHPGEYWYAGLRVTSISPISNVLTLDRVPSSFSTISPSSFNSTPTRFPDEKSSSSQIIPEPEEEGNGELVTWTQPSIIVELVGTENPSTTLGAPSLLIIEGPDQFETPAYDMGESIIINVITIASLARSLGMLMLCIMSVMNQSALLPEK